MRIIILLIACLTIILGLVMAFGGPISQIGIFDWRMAFTIMQNGAVPLMIGGGLSLAGLVIGVITKQRGTVLPTILAVLIAAGVMATLGNMRTVGGENPIHDVTTDFINPPQIVTAANADRSNPADYLGAEEYGETGKTVRQWQEVLYPDIASQSFSQNQSQVYDAALGVAEGMGWDILSSDRFTGIIEAVHTSPWFGFKDDIVIRIQEIEGRARVDVRSKSRVGRSDLGANVQRIRKFQEKLQATLS